MPLPFFCVIKVAPVVSKYKGKISLSGIHEVINTFIIYFQSESVNAKYVIGLT